jgi:hypothetical protein
MNGGYRMKTWKFLWAGVLALAVSAFIPLAQATPTVEMIVTDGTNSVTILDGGVGDLDPDAGGITFVGSVGNWTFNVDTGVSEPPGVDVAGPPFPHMDLNFQATHTSSASTLYILFGVTDFTISPLNAIDMNIGGTSGVSNTVTYDAYFDTGNVLFGRTDTAPSNVAQGQTSLTATKIGELGPFGPGAFSGAIENVAGPGSIQPYSLTQLITITSGAGTNVSSGDAGLQAAPEPASILFLGSILLICSRVFMKKLRFGNSAQTPEV